MKFAVNLLEQFQNKFLIMNKKEQYELLVRQAASLADGETDLIANMANISSLLHFAMGFWWTGFYLVKEGQLVLGPYQGPLACTRIGYGKGVCGSAWKASETIVVEDVEKFPGHIACSSESRSEIVVPIFKRSSEKKEILGVLDIDSRDLATFDSIDKEYLEKIVELLG